MRLASLLVALFSVALASAQPRPLLVTVDDLPLAGRRLHADAVERDRITSRLLDVLARHGVRAVGFVIWGQVDSEQDRAILQRWLDAGHELGNHSSSHPDYSATPAARYVADVEQGRAGLAELLGEGRSVRFFRFPMLREGETIEKLRAMREYLARSGQRAMPVTIDNQDWSYEQSWVEARRSGDREAMARIGEEYQLALRTEVLTQTELGDELFGRPVPQILLLHANEVGAAQWDELFSWLEARGYRFATADQVMADPAIAAPHEYVGGPGPGLWQRLRRERQGERARTAVAEALVEQAAAWSRGDLEGFCAGYADDAVFVSSTGITRGRAQVLERYRLRYPDASAMGRLTLEPIEMREAWGMEPGLLGDATPSRTHAITVVARWSLERSDGSSSSGHTLLVFHRVGGRWLVVQDASM